MPFILSILGVLAAAYYWMYRMRGAAEMAGELADVASDVLSAARRFGFKRKLNLHPVESIEDPNLAIAGIAVSFLELDDFPTTAHRDALNVQLRSQLRVDQPTADELIILGRWFMTESGGAAPAIARMSRKLNKIDGAKSLEPLLTIVQNTLTSGGSGLNDRQREALDDLRRAFRLG